MWYRSGRVHWWCRIPHHRGTHFADSAAGVPGAPCWRSGVALALSFLEMLTRVDNSSFRAALEVCIVGY